jgi:hypothetical protein
MNFKISQEVDVEALEKSSVINELSSSLNAYLSNRKYGEDVQNIFIGCICVKSREGFEDWFKIRRPRYKERQKIKLLDNSILELNCVFSFDIKLDFEAFINNSDLENHKLVALEITKSLSNLNLLPKKVIDFEVEMLKSDIKEFFVERGILES